MQIKNWWVGGGIHGNVDSIVHHSFLFGFTHLNNMQAQLKKGRRLTSNVAGRVHP